MIRSQPDMVTTDSVYGLHLFRGEVFGLQTFFFLVTRRIHTQPMPSARPLRTERQSMRFDPRMCRLVVSSTWQPPGE